MIGVDAILFLLMLITVINLARYLSALRSLLYIMREAHPLLYQQVGGHLFFGSNITISKRVRLYNYLKEKEYHHHHDDVFTTKCERVRQLFVLTVLLMIVTICAVIIL